MRLTTANSNIMSVILVWAVAYLIPGCMYVGRFGSIEACYIS
jgi:hypothetical protein